MTTPPFDENTLLDTIDAFAFVGTSIKSFCILGTLKLLGMNAFLKCSLETVFLPKETNMFPFAYMNDEKTHHNFVFNYEMNSGDIPAVLHCMLEGCTRNKAPSDCSCFILADSKELMWPEQLIIKIMRKSLLFRGIIYLNAMKAKIRENFQATKYVFRLPLVFRNSLMRPMPGIFCEKIPLIKTTKSF